jgi:hypothetical protein
MLALTSSVRFNRLQTLSEKCRINQNLDVLEKQIVSAIKKQIVTKRGDTQSIAPFIF